MLNLSTKPRHRNSGRPAEKDARAFLQWVRGRDCLFAGDGKCEGRIEAMHLDFAGGKGVATKVADRFAVPGCVGHHSRQHRIGWASFLLERGLTREALLKAAAFLWSKWPGRAAWERKLEGDR